MTVTTNAAEDVAVYSLLNNEVDIHALRDQVAEKCQIDSPLIEDIHPCTPMQEGLISATSWNGDYVKNCILRLAAGANLDLFREAWESIVRSMPILRTRIVQHDTLGLVQVVLQERVHWVMEDVAPSSIEKSTFTNGERCFIWNIHHVLFDGWLLSRITAILSNIYHGGVLPKQPKFNTFVAHLQSQDTAATTQFWRSLLEGCQSASFPRMQSHKNCKGRATVRKELSVPWQIKSRIRRSTYIFAAWALTVRLFTGSDEAIFGTTLSGRTGRGDSIKTVAGPTITTVPVRIQIPGEEDALSAYLESIRKQAFERIPHEDVGLRHISKVSSSARQACAFNTFLVVQPSDSNLVADPSIGEWQGKTIRSEKYPLDLEISLRNDGVKIKMDLDKELVDEWTAHQMAHTCGFVLQQLVQADLNTRLCEIEYVSPEGFKQVWQWNSRVPSANEACVHDLIAQHTRRQPDASAVCAWDGSLTYDELDKQASLLAHHFVEQLGFTMLVPVTMLAVMKAGGASVLLDTAQPEERLRSIVQQVRPGFVLSSIDHQDLARRISSTPVAPVGHELLQQLSSSEDKSPSLPSVQPSSPLYLVFTSGSTGTPKGVVISHSNFSSAIQHQQEVLGLDHTSRVFDFSGYAFDAAWLNFLHSLSAGACLCISSESGRKDDLAGAMEELRANWATLTPSTAQLIDPARTPSLRNLMLAGEMVTEQSVSIWPSTVSLRNGYGPAECSALTTIAHIRPECTNAAHVGRGIGLNTWITTVSDKSNRLAPVGAIGELWVEGPLVGQGYFEDLNKTKTNFVENPAWLLGLGGRHFGRPGRLYRTGDLVQYSSDGSLQFIGRKDGQVKIRGQRVELNEVEHWVRQGLVHSDLAPCTAVAETITPVGSPRPVLVIFLALTDTFREPESTIQTAIWTATSQLEETLRASLPEYMIPTTYIPVSEIPMSSSNKTDRRRLREIGDSMTMEQLAALQPPRRSRRVPATSGTEGILHKQFAWVLNVEPSQVGADDSFFRLGGDSISAMQLSARCRANGLKITASQIFRHKTIAQIAIDVTRILNPRTLCAETCE